MIQNVVSLISGLLFAIGLGVAGMTQPTKVVGFLDITGAWDPSLAFVMVGAIAVHFVAFRVVLKRPSPVFGGSFQIPTRRDIDPRLVAGAAIFGVGWGIAGFCPGPGLVSVMTGGAASLIFIGAMLAGMMLFKIVEEYLASRRSAAAR